MARLMGSEYLDRGLCCTIRSNTVIKEGSGTFAVKTCYLFVHHKNNSIRYRSVLAATCVTGCRKPARVVEEVNIHPIVA
jgi:hypothetical protein